MKTQLILFYLTINDIIERKLFDSIIFMLFTYNENSTKFFL